MHSRISSLDRLVLAYEKDAASLVRLARCITGSPDVAEEVVQNVFANVVDRWSDLGDLPWLEAYLRRSVINGSRMYLRRTKRSKTSATCTPEEFPVPEAHGVVDEFEQRCRVRLVREAMHSLSGRQQQCLDGRYLRGLSEGDVAEMLAISVGTVRTHTKRGMARLQDLLGA